jgi:hypothetical protein
VYPQVSPLFHKSLGFGVPKGQDYTRHEPSSGAVFEAAPMCFPKQFAHLWKRGVDKR